MCGVRKIRGNKKKVSARKAQEQSPTCLLEKGLKHITRDYGGQIFSFSSVRLIIIPRNKNICGPFEDKFLGNVTLEEVSRVFF